MAVPRDVSLHIMPKINVIIDFCSERDYEIEGQNGKVVISDDGRPIILVWSHMRHSHKYPFFTNVDFLVKKYLMYRGNYEVEYEEEDFLKEGVDKKVIYVEPNFACCDKCNQSCYVFFNLKELKIRVSCIHKLSLIHMNNWF